MLLNTDLNGRTAIITGAGRGIGRGIALAMSEAGADVAICDILSDPLAETAQVIRDQGRNVFSQVFDLTESPTIFAFVRAAVDALGDIGILVNNAAVMPGSRLESLQEETVDQILAVNLKAPILMTQAVVPSMRQLGGGSIINMSSITAYQGTAEVSVYGATKAALQGLTRGHAMELAPHGIRVNSVSPGTVDSFMLREFLEKKAKNKDAARKAFDKIHPRGCVARIEEVAAVFVFLAGDASVNITGEDIRCDGGFCVKGETPTE